MLNVRKLKQDFSQNVLKEGKVLYEEKKVLSAKIDQLDTETIRIVAKVEGQFENTYELELEIDRINCEMMDSNCDCAYHYDCQHLAALLFYLDDHLDAILVNYSKENNLEDFIQDSQEDDQKKEELLEAVKQAVSKEESRKDEQYQKEVLTEYSHASKMLSSNPFFLQANDKQADKADIAIIFTLPKSVENNRYIVELQLALRLPSRSKPLYLSSAKDFLDSIRYNEPFILSSKEYLFSIESFNQAQQKIVQMLVDYARVFENATTEKAQKSAYIDKRAFGLILSEAYRASCYYNTAVRNNDSSDVKERLMCLYQTSFENPMYFSRERISFQISFDYIDPPASKILLDPSILLDKKIVGLEEVDFFETCHPGLVYENTYYAFKEGVTRQHLYNVIALREITIPEPLFGTFIENSMVKLSMYADLVHEKRAQKITTLPFVHDVDGICDISYLDSELEASMRFNYDGFEVQGLNHNLNYNTLKNFVTKDGVIARNLVEEKALMDKMFRGFSRIENEGVFVLKSEKKIVDFMTRVIPAYESVVKFNCPQNLLDQFIYDKSEISLKLSSTKKVDSFEVKLSIDGYLKGIKIDRLYDCLMSRRPYIELAKHGKKDKSSLQVVKILVLQLSKLARLIQLFDEFGITKLDETVYECPLWSLVNVDETSYEDVGVKISISKDLFEMKKQMLGEKELKFSPIPKEINANLRPYQVEGVNWLERIRGMYLNGILADDMGLGKTLQAIVAMSQGYKRSYGISLIVCPTSLLYNWKEEFSRFNKTMRVKVIDGVPNNRKKLLQKIDDLDVLVTSYSLLQKDVDLYKKVNMRFLVLDEAQNIKNRMTRNAKSVKQIKSKHRLILTGTPIENSLDELWSLFDFLMPNFLSTYDRFVENYIRVDPEALTEQMAYLKKKVAPFILRRMKEDVLKDLPPVSEITYHCQLTEKQKELYKSYAESARNELTKLVQRDGFDKVQIHVLATLTRLKQICCHPAIFAKENVQDCDSAKYEMLQDLLHSLVEGNHKVVIFSQYTKMLQIMKKDFERDKIPFVYLDGSSKNRLEIVKKFNSDPNISVFLVSLKAGGTGLNLTGADTVIHYDMWWNPAVENQATDRVHRMGQSKNVSVYKLVTLSTIEEKIVEMQNRKRGIVKKVVSSDDEIIAKLTWEDVLELLKT